LTGAALALLEGVAPALRAGLPPATALHLAASVMTLDDRATTQLLGALDDAAVAGRPVAPVWRDAAVRTRSRELAFVGAAWQLSESTGAPLADAVDRAVAMLRAARERQRRVAVAVAGPQATVTVLTVLPLTGPLFALACGVGPVELYVHNTLAGLSAAVGLALIWLGRWWCRRMVASATAAVPRLQQRPGMRPSRRGHEEVPHA
jgi:tight adherence protein B